MIKRFIQATKNINLPKRVTLAFSGGLDSRVALHLLLKSGHEVDLAYLNHMLREDSLKEEDFVVALAEKLGLKLIKERASLSNSSEATAREARYHFLDSIEGSIVTAHHMDDNVETFIFRLLRGSSFKGLKSIPPVRGKYFRPLLSFTKEELREYASQERLEYYEDYTNDKSDYSRNYIRNEIFPMFEKINPRFREKISFFIKDLQNIESNYESLDLQREHFEFLSNQHSGTKVIDTKRGKLAKVYGEIKFIEPTSKIEKQKLPIGGEVKFFDYLIKAQYVDEIVNEDASFYCSAENLEVRQREEGDYFFPVGMKGKKSLKKFLIERKVPRYERDRVPIVVSGEEIVWVAPFRGSRQFLPKESSSIVKISMIKCSGGKDEKKK